ncbi:Methylthioribose-1-phosphate isomerase [Coemansia reversa NRRL 1564]|uniref:Methylthioribose-1-phosphate isomerase n=1 Tax=Coemansia reversa (strain ATCC 12441 / NRRL 1564) TaxID=763665 RepID=A0A2G5B9R2_COERN|nr:Methylthioribose-1-phosphate isomerase [Coemansia reversa NRRL 1564]|eukprot:PIA15755.1 Methylthioribose-1-phosphate isomerase [Coemansia reversa NRRL 1564]
MDSDSRLQAIKWERPQLTILNQLLLPHSSEYVIIRNSNDGHHAITSMQTRGAPAIAIVAALSLAAELSCMRFSTAQKAREHIHKQLEYLQTSRPTAVNLFDAVTKLRKIVDNCSGDVCDCYILAAEKMLVDDVLDNKRIGQYGSEFIEKRLGGRKVNLLTHCNTGALATAGHGTALGIIRTMWKNNLLEHVYCTETRPYNQGARLTAYELMVEKIPSTLVCDSAVSALMLELHEKNGIGAIVVGADRVAANGDTANKIGTYQLAIIAKHYGIDFIVAAPFTSVDLNIRNGSDIIIEQRSSNEITTTSGFTCASVQNGGDLVRDTLQIAPTGMNAWNPSFDVTMANLISAIVTEKGVFVKQQGEDTFDMAGNPEIF